jgi:hypothetical protein
MQMADDDLTPVDTGLVLAAAEVQQTAETSNAPVPVTAAVNRIPLPDLTAKDLVKLARELVMNIRDPKDILANFGLTQPQLDYLFTHPFFKNAYDTLLVEWNSAMNSAKRVEVVSAAYLEEGLPYLAAKLTKADESLHAQVAVGEFLAKNAKLRDAAAPSGAGEKFTISINLGADSHIRYEKDVTPTRPNEISEIGEGATSPTARSTEVPTIGKGETHSKAL